MTETRYMKRCPHYDLWWCKCKKQLGDDKDPEKDLCWWCANGKEKCEGKLH